MSRFEDLVQLRRSHRQFTPETVSREDRERILRAALMSPTSKNRRDWQFITVENRETLDALAGAKPTGAAFLAGAPLCIVVLGNAAGNDCWVEDCSIAVTSMLYQAQELGLGACWIQLKGRPHKEGGTVSAGDYVRSLLGVPDGLEVLCLVAVGRPADERQPQNEDKLLWTSVHHEIF